ncbi:MAG: UDP-N-acetylmuramate dehydrogenase [Acidobacteria bacterium]|nr:UDP-N-acetylmuramate dehydrogenase [Acidobacteriota bacterium]
MIKENVLLAPYTTLQIGGPARYFAEAQSEKQLLEALAFSEMSQLPVFILGGGSNVLIADEGFPGLVLRVAIRGIEWSEQGERVLVTSGAGEDWDEFVHSCVDRGLAGVECLSGIPGLVGGTPVQNVGAYGQEVSETITSVRVYDRLTQRIDELSNADCRFSYRASIFNTVNRDRYIVLGVTFVLKPHGEPAIRYPDVKDFFADMSTKPALKEVREAVRTIRERKAMLLVPGDADCRSAGSFFKNLIVTREIYEQVIETAKGQGLIRSQERVPGFTTEDGKMKVPAAWLIERAGFHRGYHRGRVGISSKHTLAIINRGGARAREVLELVEEIQDRVLITFAVHLHPEPVFVGFENEDEERIRNKRK